MIDWKDLLPKKSSIVVWIIILILVLLKCDGTNSDKIITPEPTEEKNDQDPNVT